MVVASLFTLMLLLYLLCTRIPFVRSLFEFIHIPLNLSFSYISTGIKILKKLLTQKYAFKNARYNIDRVKSVVIGLIIGLPVVFTLIVLLSGADPIYAKFIEGILKLEWFKIPDSWRTRILFSLFWLVFLSPLLYLRRKSEFRSPLSALAKVTFTQEMSIVMVLVALTLGSFIVIQAPYVFANVPFETDLSKFGVATYSEYVKKGFFELLFVAAFIYSLVWLGLLFLRTKPKVEQGILKYLQLAVLFEFAIFLLSIFRRIYLYQLHHGWSLVRIYGGIFLIWLTIITTILLLRHFYTKKWVYFEVGVTAVVVLFIGVFNAEHFIATTHPPTVNKRIDYVYLSRMSADGYEGWKKAYLYAQNILVNRNLEQKDLITRDERREVVYAGMVTRNLVENYHDLVQKYASFEEWLNYNNAVYNFVLNTIDADVINSEPTSSEQNTDTAINNAIQTKEGLIRELSEISRLSKKARVIDPVYNPLHFTFNQPIAYGFVDFTTIYSFYWLPTEGQLVTQAEDQPGTWDFLFSWNGSRARAFEGIKQDIPLENLFLLQKRYFELEQKIRRQSPEEREFDIDISFNTPFL